MDIIINAIGLVALVATVLGILFKGKEKVMLFFSIYFILMLSTYFLRKAYGSSLLVLVGLARSLTYYFYSKKQLKPNVYIMLLFEIIFIISVITTWSDISNLIVLLNFMVITYTAWQDNMTLFRISCAVISPFMIFYNYYVGAYMLIISESLYFLAVLVSIYKNDIVYYKKQKATGRFIR
jgi:hypothetical protein